MRDSVLTSILFWHLQVQPGQTKTVAYKQVSYHYNKDLDGKPGEKNPS